MEQHEFWTPEAWQQFSTHLDREEAKQLAEEAQRHAAYEEWLWQTEHGYR